MIIMKFGGSSVADAEHIKRVFNIVKSYLDKKPLVVVSAHKGVTDELLDLAQGALRGEIDTSQIRRRHLGIISDLKLEAKLINKLLDDLEVLLKGVSLVKELTPRTLDYVASFGERFSSRIIAEYFTSQGISAQAFDSFDIGLITDDNFGAAMPLPEADELMKTAVSKIKKVPVVTGYIGKTRSGEITTLGRNGSDYSASIVGAAIDAEEIQIWSDVDGVLTADPSIIPAAKLLEEMSFDEASELAYYGAEVLHPATMLPAIKKNIPVRVLNTFKPDSNGTLIVPTLKRKSPGVKSIVYKEDQYILHIKTPRMFLRHGFMAKVFNVLADHKISINMVSTSEVSVSLTIDIAKNLDSAIEELEDLGEVTVEKDKALVCAVGEGQKGTIGIASSIFTATKNAGVNVIMISQGASEINVAFVIDNKDITKTVKALHKQFFEK